ncbi:hypothetical protein AB3Z07_04130 [Metabacillus halosaccharovorans]|nr:hypothetical protein [Metabacillus niabensis]
MNSYILPQASLYEKEQSETNVHSVPEEGKNNSYNGKSIFDKHLI